MPPNLPIRRGVHRTPAARRTSSTTTRPSPQTHAAITPQLASASARPWPLLSVLPQQPHVLRCSKTSTSRRVMSTAMRGISGGAAAMYVIGRIGNQMPIYHPIARIAAESATSLASHAPSRNRGKNGNCPTTSRIPAESATAATPFPICGRIGNRAHSPALRTANTRIEIGIPAKTATGNAGNVNSGRIGNRSCVPSPTEKRLRVRSSISGKNGNRLELPSSSGREAPSAVGIRGMPSEARRRRTDWAGGEV